MSMLFVYFLPYLWTLKPASLIFISCSRSLHFLAALLHVGLKHQGVFKYNPSIPILTDCSWACETVLILIFIKSTFGA